MFLFSEVLNFIFNQLNNIGIVNVAISIVFFSLFYQLLVLPFSIRRGLQGNKELEKKAALEALQKEYQDKLGDEEALEEFKKKKEELLKSNEKKKKKGVGCLIFSIQFFVMLCMLNVMAYIPHYVRLLSAMDKSAVTRAYNLFGLDLRTVTSENWWPAILLVILYAAIFFLPGEIKRRKEEKRERKEWVNSLNEEERQIVREEDHKKNGISIMMGITRLISPALIVWLCIKVPCYLVVYWIANTIWKPIVFRTARFLYRKVWPAIKNLFCKQQKKQERGM